MYNCRKFLEDNKIFFETACAVFLSIMALLVSIRSCSHTETQIAMRKIENQPLLVWSGRDDDIILKNDGTPVTDWDISIEARIILQASNNSEYKEAIRRIVFAEAWYWPSGKTKGELVAIPIQSVVVVQKRLKALFTKIGIEMNSTSRVQNVVKEAIIKVSYHDVYGEHHEQYFLFEPAFGYPRLAENEGSRLFKQFKSYKPFDSGDIYAAGVRDMWLEILKMNDKSMPNKTNSADAKSRAAD